MTPSNDDKTTQMPSVEETTALPTTPNLDATVEMPTSSPESSSDPLALFREAPTAQMPVDPFRSDADTASPTVAPGAESTQAQSGSPVGSLRSGGATAFDPAFTGEQAPQGNEAGAGTHSSSSSGDSPAAGTGPVGATPGTQTWSAQNSYGSTHPLPEAPSRGVRVGSFIWAILVCMVGVLLIAETYITSFSLPILGISAVAGLGVILIVTALFSGHSNKKTKAGTVSSASNPAESARRA